MESERSKPALGALPHSSPTGRSQLEWQGDVFIGEGFAAYLGPLAPTPHHRHHAVQLMFGVGGQVSVRQGAGRVSANAIWIDSGVVHAIDIARHRAMLLYVEPGAGVQCRGVPEQIGSDATQLGARSIDRSPLGVQMSRLVGGLATGMPAVAAVAAVAAALRSLAVPRRGEPSPALRRMLVRLPDMLPGPVRLDALAASVHISPSRLSHLVRQHLGTTIRAYVRWLRLQSAARCLASGATITQAAHAAGFADSAHLNRVFRNTLGVTPSSIAQGVRWHVLP